MNSIVKAYAQLGITLHRLGAYWRSTCPYHKESDPSFTVYPDGSYYCFGCKKHGTLEDLCKKAGVDILFLTDSLDLEGRDEKKGVDLFRDLRRIEQIALAQKKVPEERASLYSRVFLAERLVFLRAHERNRIGLLRQIRNIIVP